MKFDIWFRDSIKQFLPYDESSEGEKDKENLFIFVFVLYILFAIGLVFLTIKFGSDRLTELDNKRFLTGIGEFYEDWFRK